MNKSQFMEELKNRLSQLPAEELAGALMYYSEYFDDAGQENEAQVISELGTPEQVAAQILEDFAAKNVRQASPAPIPTKAKRSAGSIALICVLAVFAAPIILPVAFALVVSLFVVLFSLFIAAGALVVSGIAVAGVSFTVVMQSPPTTLMFFGAGLLIAGIGLALTVGSIALTKASVKGIASLVRRCSGKRGSKQ